MSTTVDQRVVEMRFDNKNFESNVSTSMSTLEKLKQKLALSGATKGFEEVDAAAKKVNLTGVSGAVETISTKFSALEVMAVTTLANITNSAVNAGKRIVSALTIDPIKTGFSEYETQINAVQTILANTSNQGTTLDDVNSALDELNTYADKTIYNFTEMTKNIGTFTAAGVDLDTSVRSIQGIANLAAISGSTSQQASTAMYQLSQALAAGRVSLQDWNSVVNAGMGGQVFQNALKNTAKAMGIVVDESISFRESISGSGGNVSWLTSEVLTKTLEQFTMAAEEGTEQWEAFKLSLMEEGYSEAQAVEILKMANTATEAATKVKTFTQLFDTLKESAQSGWTQTWETIVGDFEEAKTLLTEVSEAFGAVINESSQARNDLLKGALGAQSVDTEAWEKLAKDTGIASDAFQKALTDTAREHNIAIDSMIEAEGSFEGTLKQGWLTTDIITETLSKFTGEIENSTTSLEELDEVANAVIKGAFGDGEERVKALTEAGYDYATVQSYVNHILEGTEFSMVNLSDTQLEMAGYTEEQIAALRELAKQAEETGTPINELMESMNKPTGRELLIDTFRNLLKGIAKVLKQVRDAWRETFPPMTSDQLYNIIEKIHALSAGFILTDESADNLRKTFEGLFAIIDIITTFTGGALKFGIKLLCKLLGMADVDILSLTASAGEALVKFRDWLFESNLLVKALDKLVEGVKTAVRTVKDWFKAFVELPIVQKNIENVKEAFGETFDKLKDHFGEGIEKIGEFIERVKSMDSISLSDVKDIFKDFKDNVVDHFFNFEGKFDSLKEAIKGFKDSVKEYFADVGVDLESLKNKFLNFLRVVKEKFTNNIGGILAMGTGLGLLLFVKKLSDGIEELGKPLVALGDFIEDLGKSIGKLIKAKAFKTNTEGMLNLAIALGVLAASITVLTMLDQKKLWSSVGALAVLAVILVALSAALRLLNKIGSPENASITMVAMAASLLILVHALKKMDELDSDNLLRNVTALGLLMIGLGGAVGVLGKLAPKLSVGAVTILAFAVALKILISGIKQLDGVKLDNIGSTMTVLLGAMAGLALVAAAAKNVNVGAAVTMVAIVVALNILISSFEKIADLDTGKMSSNLDAFVAIFGVFAGLMAASHLAGKNAASAGVSVLAMSAALVVIVKAIKMMAEVDRLDLDRGLETVTKLMLVFAGVIAVSKFAGNNAVKAGTMLLMMSAALLIVCGAVAMLTYIDPAKLKGAVGVVAVLEFMFAGLIAVTALAQNIKGTLVTMTVAIGILLVALGLLTLIDPSKLQNATMCLSAVLGVFALVVASTGLSKKATGTLAIIAGVIAVLGTVLYLLAQQPVESVFGAAAGLSILLTSLATSMAIISGIKSISAAALLAMGAMVSIVAILAQVIAKLGELHVGPTLETTASISLLLTAMSASCLILSAIGTASGPAIAGIGVLTVLIAAIGALMVAIGGLCELFPGMESFLDKGIDLLSKIGYGLGEFVGSIVGGLMDGIMSGLPAIGQHLSDFWTNAQVFFDGVKSIDMSTLQGVANIAATILMLTAADVLNSVTSWFTGGSSFVEFGEQLVPFGEAFAKYADTVKDVDPEVVNATSNAAKALAEFAKEIPNQGGILADWLGDNTLAQFAEGLVPFGEAFAKYAKTIDGIDPEVITASSNAATSIAEFANKIPNQGGKIAEWIGDNTLSQFAAELAEFGPKIKEYGDSVDGLKSDAVTTSATAAMAIAELANNLPNSGGYLATWIGDNTLSQFATELAEFGPALMKYATAVTDLKPEVVTNSANAATALSELADNLPNQGGVLSWYVGDNTLSKFGKDLAKFGPDLKSYADSVSNLDPKVVTNSANAAMALAELADNLPNDGGIFSIWTGNNDLESFGKDLKSFGKNFAEYSGYMENVDSGIVTTTTDAALSIVALANNLPKDGGWFSNKTSLKEFGKQMATFGENFAEYYDHVADVDPNVLSSIIDETENLVDLAKGMAKIDTSGMSSFSSSLTKLGEAGVEGFISAFTNASYEVTAAAMTMVSTFANGAESKVMTLGNSFTYLVNTGMLKTIESKYSEFRTSAQTVMDKFISGIASKSSAAKTAISDITGDVLYVIKKKYSEFVEVGQKTMNKFVSGIRAALPTPSSVYKTCLEDTIETIKGTYTEFKSAGSYVVDGFAAGISENTYKARAQAAAMASAAASAAKDELDIHSPSRVLYEIGDNGAKGFINALIDAQPVSYDAGAGVAESAKSGLQRAISKIADVVDDNIDTQPTIRPVLDLSKFEAATRRLNSMIGRTQALHISSDMNRDTREKIQNEVPSKTGGNTYNYTQNNYSPKALSRVEIYRQTKNQFSAMERMVEA